MRRLPLTLGVLAAALAAAPCRAGEAGDAAALAATIDEQVAARWKEKGVEPAAPADDAEFLRRAYLDLNGRIPDILTARDFLDNPDPQKREKLIDRLLASDRYAAHFAAVWRARLFPQSTNFQLGFAPYQAEPWLRKQLQDNTPYDRMVRGVVMGGADPVGQAFYQAAEFKAEEVASRTARLFLGVKVGCAQCHDHPFDKWKRQQFWDFAAFFAPSTQQFGGVPGGGRGELKIPGTDKAVRPRFLDGVEPKLTPGQDPRPALLDWMTAADNPYFARATVNHTWEYFFGVGLVEPPDEESADNPPSHPELLDELARRFAAHGYDLKYLIRGIVLSKPYQLSSRRPHPGPDDPRLFGRARVRGLSPEQLYDCLALATGNGADDPANPAPPNFNPGAAASPRLQFLARFPEQDRPVEAQTSALQALYFMNGKVTADACNPEHNKNLRVLADAQSVPVPRRVEQLFLIVLSRKPRPEERERFVAYVEKGGPDGDQRHALADVFWALLNSAEFATNH
jgi:hypothetical protein